MTKNRFFFNNFRKKKVFLRFDKELSEQHQQCSGVPCAKHKSSDTAEIVRKRRLYFIFFKKN